MLYFKKAYTQARYTHSIVETVSFYLLFDTLYLSVAFNSGHLTIIYENEHVVQIQYLFDIAFVEGSNCVK